MDAVYCVYQASLERAVAVKVITPELAHDITFLERFNRETQTAAGLEHAHIVPVYDHGSTLLASAGDDHTVRLWDVSTEQWN